MHWLNVTRSTVTSSSQQRGTQTNLLMEDKSTQYSPGYRQLPLQSPQLALSRLELLSIIYGVTFISYGQATCKPTNCSSVALDVDTCFNKVVGTSGNVIGALGGGLSD